MKMKIAGAILLLCSAATLSYGQITIQGQVTNTNGDSIKKHPVLILPDTSTTPPFTPYQVTTDSSTGTYITTIPNSASFPVNSRVFIRTPNCDSTFITDTVIIPANPATITNNIKICVLPPVPVFSGYVFLGSSSKRPPVKEAWIYLVSRCSGNVVTVINTTESDTNGYYQFASYPAIGANCELLVRAIQKTTAPEYTKYLPAYYESSGYALRWSEGQHVSKTTAQASVNVLLPEAMNPFGGPSVISGKAIDSATGNFLAGRVMLLTDMNDVPVAYVFTDNNGDFAFNNLPFGTYKLFGDAWGRENPALIVKVDADHVNATKIIFRESATVFKGTLGASGVTEINSTLSGLFVYPNPVKDKLHVHGLENVQDTVQAILTDSKGVLVYKGTLTEGHAINASNLAQGMYLLQLRTERDVITLKVIK